MYILDSDTFTLFRNKNLTLANRIEAFSANDIVALSTITVEEALTGWYSKARQAKSLRETAQASNAFAISVSLVAEFLIVPETEVSLMEADRLVKAGLNVGKKDIRIAAIALELGATVVTRNHRDFSRIPKLSIVDWSI